MNMRFGLVMDLGSLIPVWYPFSSVVIGEHFTEFHQTLPSSVALNLNGALRRRDFHFVN